MNPHLIIKQKKEETNFPPNPVSQSVSDAYHLRFCLWPVSIWVCQIRLCGLWGAYAVNTEHSSDHCCTWASHPWPIFACDKKKTHPKHIDENVDNLAIDCSCDMVCNTCLKLICHGRTPQNSLANGLWLGCVPDVLKSLTWVKQRLIAWVRANTYAIQMSSGHYKIKGNVIAFTDPIPKVYNILPLHIADLDHVLAIVFVSLSMPTQEDLKRSPLLVRQNVVATALAWLILNHKNYWDVMVLQSILNEYPECDILWWITPALSTLLRAYPR